jgi:hypothetical protein
MRTRTGDYFSRMSTWNTNFPVLTVRIRLLAPFESGGFGSTVCVAPAARADAPADAATSTRGA